ncbi:MAG: hypothetical protein PHC88_08000 [Terrimicrobiaceae bacterium]|nr:hypothetical protein [Terrimicrobiaceae bacterium]
MSGSAGIVADGESLDRARRVRAALPAGGLFEDKAWRVSPRAFPVSRDLAAELDQLGFRLHQFLRACNQLYRLSAAGRQPAWIAGLLDRGKPPELIEAARDRMFRDEIPTVIRPDLVLTDDGFTIAELDSVPGGIGLTAWLGREYAALGEDILGGAHGMLEGFAGIVPGGDIVISAEAATYRPEMEWLAARLNERQGDTRRWRVVDDAPRDDWQPTVYRFFELFDLANVRCAGQLIEKARAGALRVTPPFKPQLEEKLWFALFWLRPLEAYWLRELGEKSLAALRRVIPYTWLLDPAPLPPHAVLPRLEVQSWDEVAAFSQKQRELILKVSGFSDRAWGSRGVIVAQDVPHSAWREALEGALAAYGHQPHLLQQFHKGRVFEHPWLDEESGALATMKGRVRLCPYFFPGGDRVKCAGALATICPQDKKLLHGMSDAILVPTAVAGD